MITCAKCHREIRAVHAAGLCAPCWLASRTATTRDLQERRARNLGCIIRHGLGSTPAMPMMQAKSVIDLARKAHA
jgi:hypothetical protein